MSGSALHAYNPFNYERRMRKTNGAPEGAVLRMEAEIIPLS